MEFAKNGKVIGKLTQEFPQIPSKLIGGDKVFGILNEKVLTAWNMNAKFVKNACESETKSYQVKPNIIQC